ncbi:MAG: SGNH/GDSL hydrolase family protein [Anaerolineales bacterium]|nr:SGNH/GDSL hydrolase family protein [Anaerolineales bacterium]
MFKNKIGIFLIFFFLTSCGGSVTTTPTPASLPSNSTIRYLALGDSYTIGESVPENERWSNQLAELIGGNIEVKIIARTGWTTSELWQGIQKETLTPPYDMVSLLIGVNNQYRGYDKEEYRQEFVFLLNKAIEYAGGDKNKVFVVSIPDWGVTPFAKGRNAETIASEIDAFNQINKEESEKLGIAYVDVTPISREAVNDADLIAPDGLHPSGKMYAEWAKLALPVALEILR